MIGGNVRSGIHSKDWDKLIERIKTELPEEYSTKVILILYELCTHYI